MFYVFLYTFLDTKIGTIDDQKRLGYKKYIDSSYVR